MTKKRKNKGQTERILQISQDLQPIELSTRVPHTIFDNQYQNRNYKVILFLYVTKETIAQRNFP